jgi:chitodextrinase
MKSKPRLIALSCIAMCMITMSTISSTSGNITKTQTIHSSTSPVVPEWSSTTSYSTGSYVVYMNKLYRSAHLTQGDTPRGFGLYPDGPWVDLGPCI